MPPRKDPNKPKGKSTAYAFFVKERRKLYKDKGQNVDFAEFARECSSIWKEMEDDEKTDFKKQSDEDKVRYDREMESYAPPEGGKGRRRNKKEKEPGQPKRSM